MSTHTHPNTYMPDKINYCIPLVADNFKIYTITTNILIQIYDIKF